MAIKEYFRPKTLKEASELLGALPESAKILAGGTDLLVPDKQNVSSEIQVISLRDIDELKKIEQKKQGYIYIGARATHTDIAQSPVINKYFPALAKASSLVGSPSIRNLGTIGGNICNASPSADTAPPLLAYNAKVVIWCSSGQKKVNIENFFSGPQKNILQAGEIMKGFILHPEKGLVAGYEKIGIRKAMEIAIVNVGIAMKIEKKKYCSQIRIALGAVAPTPIRAQKAERILENHLITSQQIKKSAEAVINATNPISDIRASADYRKKMTGFLVKKIISELSGIRVNKN